MNEIMQNVMAQFSDPSGLFITTRTFIQDRFGTPGLIAAAILLVSIAGMILSKAVKMSFDILRYVVIPAVAVTFIGTYFLPLSFVYIFPVTVAFFSIVLIVKG
ncbi:MAG: hypothetical protein CVT49_13830 [candidate division Zixibacteria bacterium HGW-Zixibacteria-1]|nr:MAG: hypothetical protein CVT49_13830 [candidate division Zixibacteria bacterium HGW-Zixibacteria-1]